MTRTIVFDNGAGSLKARMAGDKRPSHIMPNYIAMVKGQVGNLGFHLRMYSVGHISPNGNRGSQT